VSTPSSVDKNIAEKVRCFSKDKTSFSAPHSHTNLCWSWTNATQCVTGKFPCLIFYHHKCNWYSSFFKHSNSTIPGSNKTGVQQETFWYCWSSSALNFVVSTLIFASKTLNFHSAWQSFIFSAQIIHIHLRLTPKLCWSNLELFTHLLNKM